MATKYELVTPQAPWRLGNPADKFFKTQASSIPLSLPEAYSDSPTAWATVLEAGTWPGGGGGDRLVLEMDPNDDEHGLIAFKFYGGGTEGQGAVGRIWGIVKTIATADEYLGDYICEFELVLGSKAIGAGSALPSGKKWFAAITPIVDAAAFPGIRVAAEQGYSAVSSGQASAAPELIFAGLGYDMYIIEIRRQAPAGSMSGMVGDAGVVYRLI